MLGKLFKYDMKQISRIMLPLVLLTFGTTLFGTAALKTVNEVVVPMESGVAQNVLLSSLYMVFGISVFVLAHLPLWRYSLRLQDSIRIFSPTKGTLRSRFR